MNIHEHYTMLENTAVAQDVFRMRLAGNTAAFTRPGQFLNIALDRVIPPASHFHRRL